MAHKKEMPSCFRLIPGLDDDVNALAPAMLAPITIFMAANSLSAWTKTPSSRSFKRRAIYSVISFCGVIG